MKGTKKIFNALHSDENFQSEKMQQTINQLRTLIADVEKKGGYVFIHPICKEISSKCNILRSHTDNVESKKALSFIQGHFDRFNSDEFHNYEADELMDSIIPDIWDPISDD